MTELAAPGFVEVFLRTGLVQLPLLVVVAVGGFAAARYRTRLRQVASRVALGLALLGLYAVLQTLRMTISLRLRFAAGAADPDFADPLAPLNFPIYLLLLGGIVVLSTAVFMDRAGADRSGANT